MTRRTADAHSGRTRTVSELKQQYFCEYFLYLDKIIRTEATREALVGTRLHREIRPADRRRRGTMSNIAIVILVTLILLVLLYLWGPAG